MKKSLENADHLAKLVLAFCVIIFYVLDIIKGPFAIALLMLACITILISLVRLAYRWLTLD